MPDLLEDPDGAPYPDKVQTFLDRHQPIEDSPGYDFRLELVAALEAIRKPLLDEIVRLERTGPDVSVQPDWARSLPIQQQSVLFLAARGPDGVAKHHPCKQLVKAYRACVLRAATLRRELTFLDQSDGFMDASVFGVKPNDPGGWYGVVATYLHHVDELPHHYHLHLVHGAQILGYHHPDPFTRDMWDHFYRRACDDLHMEPESRETMDQRLNDFGTSPGGRQS